MYIVHLILVEKCGKIVPVFVNLNEFNQIDGSIMPMLESTAAEKEIGETCIRLIRESCAI